MDVDKQEGSSLLQDANSVQNVLGGTNTSFFPRNNAEEIGQRNNVVEAGQRNNVEIVQKELHLVALAQTIQTAGGPPHPRVVVYDD